MASPRSQTERTAVPARPVPVPGAEAGSSSMACELPSTPNSGEALWRDPAYLLWGSPNSVWTPPSAGPPPSAGWGPFPPSPRLSKASQVRGNKTTSSHGRGSPVPSSPESFSSASVVSSPAASSVALFGPFSPVMSATSADVPSKYVPSLPLSPRAHIASFYATNTPVRKNAEPVVVDRAKELEERDRRVPGRGGKHAPAHALLDKLDLVEPMTMNFPDATDLLGQIEPIWKVYTKEYARVNSRLEEFRSRGTNQEKGEWDEYLWLERERVRLSKLDAKRIQLIQIIARSKETPEENS